MTIDDGYADVRSQAHPVLRAHGLAATVFVITERMGAANRWDPEGSLQGRSLLSWEEARELHRGGLTLGAHTRTHRRLTDLSEEELEAEVGGSRRDLAAALGSPVETFAYPYGKWNDAAARAVAGAGFGCAVSIRTGRNCAATPPYALRRTEIHGDDSFFTFVLAVAFGDARILERFVRRVRRR